MVPGFLPAFVESLGFTARKSPGLPLGFLVAGLPFGLLAGAVIDRIGARWVILSGAGLIAFPSAHGFHDQAVALRAILHHGSSGICAGGAIANQVLVAHWFRVRRGRAMGYAYLGLGLGGVISPLLVHFLMRSFGWRHALESWPAYPGRALPGGIWITRSNPGTWVFCRMGRKAVVCRKK